jgi:hypothetical protein
MKIKLFHVPLPHLKLWPSRRSIPHLNNFEASVPLRAPTIIVVVVFYFFSLAFSSDEINTKSLLMLPSPLEKEVSKFYIDLWVDTQSVGWGSTISLH